MVLVQNISGCSQEVTDGKEDDRERAREFLLILIHAPKSLYEDIERTLMYLLYASLGFSLTLLIRSFSPT